MNSAYSFISQNLLDLVALVWFLFCFRGYMGYARKRSLSTPCLASTLHMYRNQWMMQVMERDNRISDTSAIANLERSVAFFASTTMLILAGLMTVLGAAEQAIDVVADIPFAVETTRQMWEVKVLLLIVLFVYAFFKFTWSLRQYGFVSVMIGGAPTPNQALCEQEKQVYASRMARMASKAAGNFNIGLRTFYFSQAVLGWFINPLLFMALAALVTFILYRREFRSSTLQVLTQSQEVKFLKE